VSKFEADNARLKKPFADKSSDYAFRKAGASCAGRAAVRAASLDAMAHVERTDNGGALAAAIFCQATRFACCTLSPCPNASARMKIVCRLSKNICRGDQDAESKSGGLPLAGLMSGLARRIAC